MAWRGDYLVTNQPVRLFIHIDAGAGTDDEETEQLARRLRGDLQELDIDGIDNVRSEAAPAGAKGDPVTLSALALTLAPVVLTGLMKALQTWLSRHERASVTVKSGQDEFVMTGSPSREQQEAINNFLSHHKP
jgi:hypothetical protein